MAERSEAVQEQVVRDALAAYAVKPESATAEDVPLGYKRTEVGVIPEDWVVLRLGDRATFKKGFGLSKADLSESGSHQCIHYGQLYTLYGEVINEVVSRTDRSIRNATVSREKDVLMPTSDVTPRGLATASCLAQGNVYLGGDILVIRPDANELVGEYLAYAVKVFRHRIMRLVSGTTVYHLYPRDMAQFRFPVPNVGEQHAIATALSDADALIESLDRLIAKKRAIKQAAMQQLLTGQTRLPGFTGEWETKRLGNVASFHKGSGLSKADLLVDGSSPCIHYGELFTQYGERITSVNSRTDRKAACFKSIENDVLMPTSDVTPSGLATASCIANSNVILGGDILIIRPTGSEIDGTFLAYKIRMDHRQIMQLVSGTTVFHIYGRDMAEFTYKAPAIEEQQAIVSVLSDMDTEIESLERRRVKARQIKQGMMQQLLTGRVRLVAPGPTVGGDSVAVEQESAE
ncbi:restriction endonuclease subunit S [Thioalkalivibrio sp. ALJ16]|uniref:restriction endonuclease subunit S n=1 Tax=Thioalkalivibrio sp. ALJ16 TaxID=1158762 RepID=UPI0009DB5C4F|nr:restriction endonuclease subunit S [Thioalkalivibrio sp. ALJ16]